MYVSFRESGTGARASATARPGSHAAYCLCVSDNGRTADGHRDKISPPRRPGPIPGVGTLVMDVQWRRDSVFSIQYSGPGPGPNACQRLSDSTGSSTLCPHVVSPGSRRSQLHDIVTRIARAAYSPFLSSQQPEAQAGDGIAPSQARHCQNRGPHSHLRMRSRARPLRALPRPPDVFPAWSSNPRSSTRIRNMGISWTSRGCDTSSSGTHQFQASFPCFGSRKGSACKGVEYDSEFANSKSVCPVGRDVRTGGALPIHPRNMESKFRSKCLRPHPSALLGQLATGERHTVLPSARETAAFALTYVRACMW